MKKNIIEITSAAAKLIDIVEAMQKKNEKKKKSKKTHRKLVTLDNVALVRRQNSPFHSSHTIKFKQSCNCFLWWCEKNSAEEKQS